MICEEKAAAMVGNCGTTKPESSHHTLSSVEMSKDSSSPMELPVLLWEGDEFVAMTMSPRMLSWCRGVGLLE